MRIRELNCPPLVILCTEYYKRCLIYTPSVSIFSLPLQAVLLSVKSTVADMTDGGDGSYRATAAGQQILQTMDTAALAEAYGADSQVTGVTLFGAPAYRTGTGICTLTALEESSGAVTEYGKHELTDKTTAIVWDGCGASFSMAEMEARKFGWKAGE